MTSHPASENRHLCRDGVRYRVTLPDWGAWLTILDQSAQGQDQSNRADISRLLSRWLVQTVQIENADGTWQAITNSQALPVPLADALIHTTSAALEDLSETLQITQEDDTESGGFLVIANKRTYKIKPLDFGARNACLARHLTLTSEGPQIDASGYEISLLLASVQCDGHPLTYADLLSLPIPLGEALVTLVRKLSDPAVEEELTAFASAGQPHPDLDLADLCLTYGLNPEKAQALPAATAQRLLAAARLLRASHPIKADLSTQSHEDDRVTRIVVHDD